MHTHSIEIYPGNELLAGRNTPYFIEPESGARIMTTRTSGMFFERIGETDPSYATLPGRVNYAQGAPVICKHPTNAEYRGIIVMDFRPGYIPVEDAPDLNAWVAHIPPDTLIDNANPFGHFGWVSGPLS